MDVITFLLNALLAIFLGSDTAHWRPDTTVSHRPNRTSDLGT